MASPLDSAPPQPTMAGLSGPQGGQAPGDGSAQQSIMEKMMTVEKLLGDISDIKPEAGPIISDLVQQMRARLGKVVMQQGPSAPSGGQLANLSGLVTTGAGASTPTS